MGTVRAIFEGGVFYPQGEVDLPEHCEVVFEPKVIAPKDPNKAQDDPVESTIGSIEEEPADWVRNRHDEPLGDRVRPVPGSFLEKARGLAGSIEGPGDLSFNKKYLEGYGR
jgi:predicted DNA-binding antitoxin AbrB/MazE fold protein